VNTFTQAKLIGLFPGAKLLAKSLVESSRDATNAASALLLDMAGNPWGVYEQEEPCIHCGAKLTPPKQIGFAQRALVKMAAILDKLQEPLVATHGNWIHLVFTKA
jgi:hypothetical protein